jgi:succinate dehydrogenase / fumarate reductase membrane anchor subunit
MLSRSGGTMRPSGSSFEVFSWYFLRISGLALVLLAVLHVVIMHVVNTDDEIDHQFVVDRWSSPFWQFYDFLLLALALLHGVNGARICIEDYIRRPGWRVAAYSALSLLTLAFLALGTLAIVTFNPAEFEATVAGR